MLFQCEFKVGENDNKGYWRCKKRTIERYCSAHRCQYKSPRYYVCNHIVLTDGSDHCNRHNCRAPQCDLMISGNNYCQEHMCSVKHCIRMKLSDEEHCGKHYCCFPSCYNIINNPINGKSLCEEHSCQINGCKGLPTNRVDMLCKFHKKT